MPTRRTPRRLTAVIASLAALGLAAGCGDEDGAGGGDDEAITAVITEAVTTTDVEAKCVETVTEGFVNAVYGDLGTCRRAEAPEPDDDPPPTGVDVTAITIDGDSANARATTRGGETDGAAGTLSLEKVDETWKVSELGVDLLRSQLSVGLERGTFDASDGPLQDETIRTCLNSGLQGLDDEAFRRIAFSSIRDEDPDPTFLEVFTGCARDSTGGQDGSEASGSGGSSGQDGDLSLLRRQFESGIRESAEDDGTEAEVIDCVLAETRESISEDDIVEQVRRGPDDVDPEIAGRVAAAIQACG